MIQFIALCIHQISRVLLCLASIAWLLTTHDAHAEGSPRIRVRGSATITARASQDQGDLLLSGSLVDDANEPLDGKTITVHVTRDSDAGESADAAVDESPDVTLLTDEGGRFSLRTKLPRDRYTAHLAWAGGTFFDEATHELAFDLSRESLVLRFDPVPHVLELDEPRTIIEVLASVHDGATLSRPKVGTRIRLTNERGDEIGTAPTDETGRARFQVESVTTGAPGKGELHASLVGDEASSVVETVNVERRAKVSLHVPAVERGELLRAMVPDDGIPIAVDVTSIAGPVPEGAVEAHIGNALIGAAPVERGQAQPTLTFAAQSKEVHVNLRYVPNAPFYEPAEPYAFVLPLRSPSLFAKAPILLAGLAVLAFFFGGRVAAKRTRSAPMESMESDEKPTVDGLPRIEVVHRAAHGEAGLCGKVRDAHDETPIAHARVWIERGSFEGTTILARAETDERGRFRLDVEGPFAGDERIVAEAPLHARLEQPAPHAGELSIALVSRRRALLSRMVTWARSMGVPFDTKPEPTPGHIRRAAADNPETARWAEAVEHAAFGRAVVDAAAEARVDALSPEEKRTTEYIRKDGE
ncbi:MAG: hypothetical protein FWD69_16545 [Polyangiaceae bacterium]|nr:hypothetical protein [Polyangiaceae bacterium]